MGGGLPLPLGRPGPTTGPAAAPAPTAGSCCCRAAFEPAPRLRSATCFYRPCAAVCLAGVAGAHQPRGGPSRSFECCSLSLPKSAEQYEPAPRRFPNPSQFIPDGCGRGPRKCMSASNPAGDGRSMWHAVYESYIAIPGLTFILSFHQLRASLNRPPPSPNRERGREGGEEGGEGGRPLTLFYPFRSSRWPSRSCSIIIHIPIRLSTKCCQPHAGPANHPASQPRSQRASLAPQADPARQPLARPPTASRLVLRPALSNRNQESLGPPFQAAGA